MNVRLLVVALLCTLAVHAQEPKKAVPLPSSKTLLTPVPGAPQLTSSSAETLAVSPDGRWVAVLNNGYGTDEAQRRQSIAVLDLSTNRLRDFPDARFAQHARYTFFVGLAFSADGRRLYASVASLTDPTGEREGSLGNGIAVYGFDDGEITPQGFLKIPLQPLRSGQQYAQLNSKLPGGKAIPYPAGLAGIPGVPERLLVADNLSDDALLLDATTGQILKRFDLSSSASDVPASYPYTVAVAKDGRRAWVSLWNASSVAELNLQEGAVVRWIPLLTPKSPTAPGSHPTALLLSPDERRLYVTLSNADRVAVVDTKSAKVLTYLGTTLPGQLHSGAYPNALAQSGDGKLLFVANASSDAVAVCDTQKLKVSRQPQAPLGFIPTDWYPTALAVRGDDLVIATAKAQGTGPNKTADPAKPTYIAALLHGSVARLSIADTLSHLRSLTQEVLESNLMLRDAAAFTFAGGANPIKHVIYVLKENRTYDQVFGDLKWGDGDPSLVLYGESITPNQHQLARQFGILDNFYVSGEVSGDGHVWSTAAIASDYTEKTWQINYRNGERTYDYGGEVSGELPLYLGIPDVNEPGSGYLWTNLARHNLTYRQYGEFIDNVWCNGSPNKGQRPKERNLPPGGCPRAVVRPGEPLPANVGQPRGGPSPWPWPVPLVGTALPTKPELRGHFDEKFPGWNLEYPDLLRADEFLNEFDGFVRARREGKGTQLPQFMLLYLPNDHTSGTTAGRQSPAAMVADNDLALGRVVDAVSHSPYWDDTAIFVLEDDAQNGGDHVDAHRSIALVISKYAPGTSAQPLVDHAFYTTVSMIHTMEALLGLPPMNNNDARAPLMAPLFAGKGDQAPFTADETNLKNRLIYEVNPPKAPGATASAQLDFSHPDAADTAVLNAILWRAAKGDRIPPPKPRHNRKVHQVIGEVDDD